MDETLSKLIEAGTLPPVIVVGVCNSVENRHADYFPQKPVAGISRKVWESLVASAGDDERVQSIRRGIRSDAYLRFLLNELKPMIDATFRTRPEREHTYIAGSSMGGLISFYAVCEYPDAFAGAACLSTHWLGSFQSRDNPIPDAFAAYAEAHLPPPGKHRFYFDFGTEGLDSHYQPHQRRIDAVFREKGYSSADWVTREFAGADHSEKAWAERLVIPLSFLLSQGGEKGSAL